MNLAHMPARQRLVLASPILVVLVGYLAAHFFSAASGEWAWVGTCLTYWSSLILIIWSLGEKRSIKAWFEPSQGSKWWLILALAMGLIAFPLLLIPNIRVLNSLPLNLAWFFFAVINSVCEEAYWRGFLLDELSHPSRRFGVFYSSFFFIVIHPAMLGAFSKIQSLDPAHPLALVPFLIILIAISLAYSLIYLKTKSLRWPIFSHFLSDLGNLSIFLFMNMVV